MTSKLIEVVAAIILSEDKTAILISKRPEHLHKGGYWEFPGGKVDAGESQIQALCRELAEELNIAVVQNVCEAYQSLKYDYPEKSVHLHFYKVYRFDNAVDALEGQQWAWVPIAELESYQFPEANEPIVSRLLAELSEF